MNTRNTKKQIGDNSMEETQDANIWDDFGVTEEQWDAISSQLQNAEESAGDLVEYCKAAFPTNVEAQIKAFVMAMDYHEWQSDEETEEDENVLGQ